MEVPAVDERHIDRRAAERPGRIEPAEPAAEDEDAVPQLLGYRTGLGNREAHRVGGHGATG